MSGAYGAIAYKSMEAKTYYPVEWTLACLITHDKDDLAKETMREAKKLGINLLQPDINKSDDFFQIEKVKIDDKKVKCLRYGLSSIKNVGSNAVKVIKYAKETLGDFTGLDDFYTKVHSLKKEQLKELGCGNNPVNKRVEETLIKVGAFDEFEPNRYKLINQYNSQLRKEKNYVALNEKSFNKQIKLEIEIEYLGMYISEHPLDDYPYQNFENTENEDMVETAGLVLDGSICKTKNGKPYGKITIEDKDSVKIPIMLFGGVFTNNRDKLFNDDDTVKKNKIIIIEGEVNKMFRNINAKSIRLKSSKKKQSKKPVNDCSTFIPEVVDIDFNYMDLY